MAVRGDGVTGAPIFRSIHGLVRTAKQLGRILSVIGIHGDADARAYVERLSLHRAWIIHRAQHPFGGFRGSLLVGARHHRGELVAAESRSGVGASQSDAKS